MWNNLSFLSRIFGVGLVLELVVCLLLLSVVNVKVIFFPAHSSHTPLSVVHVSIFFPSDIT